MGWREREILLFDGCFVFTTVPEASFDNFRAACSISITTDAQVGGKETFIFSCVRHSDSKLGHHYTDIH